MKPSSSHAGHQRPMRLLPGKNRLKGLTLIELLVALAISSILALAAIAALVISRQGFTSVDAASQLRDNARFSTDLIQRLSVQAGYKDLQYASTNRTANAAGLAANPDPNITGFNNARASATDPVNTSTARAAGSAGFGSDILILRHQVSETFPGSGISDRSMINCAGVASAVVPADRDAREISILHVAVSLGELSLMCTTINSVSGDITTQPIVQGVENFQVLYGVDNVVPNTAPAAGAASDAIADRFLRADQMVVAADPVGTNANWRRVRSLRIGMVIRAAAGSAQEIVSQTFYPLGSGRNAAGGTPGSALSSANDPGTVFTPTADNRLRQIVTFTVQLRNGQEF
ncbi:MAG: PilW family protein [Burkholderiaceae bacterium]